MAKQRVSESRGGELHLQTFRKGNPTHKDRWGLKPSVHPDILGKRRKWQKSKKSNFRRRGEEADAQGNRQSRKGREKKKNPASLPLLRSGCRSEKLGEDESKKIGGDEKEKISMPSSSERARRLNAKGIREKL